MWRWGCAFLFSLALWGCGDDACVRQSDCASGLRCAAGQCVAPPEAGPDAPAADRGGDSLAPPSDARPEAAPDGAEGAPDGSTPDAADAQADTMIDGGTDA